jgi:hypothetical protein
MASFEIDTGTSPLAGAFPRGPGEALLFAVMDSLPEDATQAQIDSRLVQMITGMLRKPKTLPTVRRKLVSLFPLLAELSDREPEQFDAIILEYLDRQQTLTD